LKLFENKTVAIVGNSPCLMNKKQGELIDSFDIVIRFNNYKITDDLKAYTGTKQNVWSTSFYVDIPIRSEVYEHVICPYPITTEKWHKYRNYADKKSLEKYTNAKIIPLEYFDELVKYVPVPSSGIAVLYWLFREGVKITEDNVFGFNFFSLINTIPNHYFEQKMYNVVHSNADEKYFFNNNLLTKTYEIKKEYSSRDHEIYFDDSNNTNEYQNDIYLHAKKLVEENKFNTVLDIGCGSGFKLIEHFNDKDVTGIELPKTVDFLTKKYPNNRWLSHDFSMRLEGTYDLVLCVDIIQQLLFPDDLLAFLETLDFKIAIISTVERDKCRGVNHLGPSPNYWHVREWNNKEFNKYISSRFRIIFQDTINTHEQFLVVTKYDSK